MSEEKKVVAEVEEETPVAVVAPTMASVVHDPNAPVITMKKLLEAGAHLDTKPVVGIQR